MKGLRISSRPRIQLQDNMTITPLLSLWRTSLSLSSSSDRLSKGSLKKNQKSKSLARMPFITWSQTSAEMYRSIEEIMASTASLREATNFWASNNMRKSQDQDNTSKKWPLKRSSKESSQKNLGQQPIDLSTNRPKSIRLDQESTPRLQMSNNS